ncbi:MAG: hypothetical protein IT374_15620 [Polyangiaceae bacterium]|nr:hypothetical protein [Polyangiaceae bacterium]
MTHEPRPLFSALSLLLVVVASCGGSSSDVGQTGGSAGGAGAVTSYRSLCEPACATVRSCFDGPRHPPEWGPFDTDACLASCQREAEGTGTFEPALARFMLQYVADFKDDPDCELGGDARQGHGWMRMSMEPGLLERLPQPTRDWTATCVNDWVETCPDIYKDKPGRTGDLVLSCFTRYSRYRDPDARRPSEACFHSKTCGDLGHCSLLVPLPTPGGSWPWY